MGRSVVMTQHYWVRGRRQSAPGRYYGRCRARRGPHSITLILQRSSIYIKTSYSLLGAGMVEISVP